jgi:hypothetical protein
MVREDFGVEGRQKGSFEMDEKYV